MIDDDLWAHIRRVLKTEWEPLPGSPSDEYDSYIAPIVLLLRRSASSDEIADYLEGIFDGVFDEPMSRAQQLHAAKCLQAIDLGVIP